MWLIIFYFDSSYAFITSLIVPLKVLTKEDLSFLPLKRIDKKIDKEVTKEISDDRTRKERDVAEKRKL